MEKTADTSFTKSIEFKEFSKSFVEGFPNIEVGTYKSDDRKYEVRWMDGVVDGIGKKVPCGRVAHKAGYIQLDKNFFDELDENFLYFIIVWMIIEREIKNPIVSDRIAIEHYLNVEKRPYKSLLKGFLKLSKDSTNIELSKKRCEAIVKMNPKKD